MNTGTPHGPLKRRESRAIPYTRQQPKPSPGRAYEKALYSWYRDLWEHAENSRRLKYALIISLVLHGLVFLVLFFGMQYRPPIKPAGVYHVSFVTDAASPNSLATAVKPPTPEVKKPEPPKPVEKKEPPKPVVKKDPPKPVEKKEPPKPEVKKETPKPVEKKTETPKPPEKKEPPKKETKKVPDMKPLAPPDEPQPDIEPLAPPDEPVPDMKPIAPPDEALPTDPKSLDTVIGMQSNLPSELSGWSRLVQRQVFNSWQMPIGVRADPEENQAEISVWVNRNGELVGEPVVLSQGLDPELAQTGIEAVKNAAPFPPFPDNFSDPEQQVVFTFTPML